MQLMYTLGYQIKQKTSRTKSLFNVNQLKSPIYLTYETPISIILVGNITQIVSLTIRINSTLKNYFAGSGMFIIFLIKVRIDCTYNRNY